jgi:GT2 family glycosyltransferase
LGEKLALNCIVEPEPAASDQPDINAPQVARYRFSLNAHVPLGFHIGIFEQASADGSEWRAFHTLSILSEVAPLMFALDSRPPAPARPETWHVYGWCFHPQADVESVSVQFGEKEATIRHGLLRPDVARVFQGFSSALHSGFTGQLALTPGSGPVRLIARLANGLLVRSTILPELVIPDQELNRIAVGKIQRRAARIRFPVFESIAVSIVIPVFNQLQATLDCLESISRHAGSTAIEVIIIDDNSEKQLGETLSLVEGLTVLSNDQNRGFIYNSNLGAMEARGDYVLFLNNDTEVTEGWLESLIHVFSKRADAGAVGAKLVYPDGRLQEAGGIIFEDGSGHNYGRGDDPSLPEYNYLRRADYCSGAALMVPRNLFMRIGGFDPVFCPAYYEDVDLAFSIRAAGLHVYYQPESVVIHHEGTSSGTDTRVGPKRHQLINQSRFATKWAGCLAGLGHDHSVAGLARDRHAIGRILVIDACALTPDMDAGSLRMFNLLKILARQGCKVTFAAENLQFHEPFSSVLRGEGVEHIGVPAVYDLADYISLHAFAFDVIILSRKFVANRFIDLIRQCAPSAKIIFDTVDLMFLRLFRQAEVEGSEEIRGTAEASREIELDLCAKSDLVYVVSPEEASILGKDIAPDKIAVVPLIHEVVPSDIPFSQRSGVLFVGGYQHPPNLDAIEYFLDKVFPLLSDRLPDLKVHVVGSNMPARLQQRASKSVVIHGHVPNLVPILNTVRASIAPLRYGAGVKGKVNQSMAHGVPVVASSIATEGMYLVDGENVLVGDTPQAFADAVFRIHSDANIWAHVSAAGLKNIERHFSFEPVKKALFDSLQRLIPSFLESKSSLPGRPIPECGMNETLYFGHTNTAGPFLDGGWSEAVDSFRWAIGRDAWLRLRFSASAQPQRLRLTIFPLLVPGLLERQRLHIDLPQGCSPADVELTKKEAFEVDICLPKSIRPMDILTLHFNFPDARTPREMGISDDVRLLSIAFLNMTFS